MLRSPCCKLAGSAASQARALQRLARIDRFSPGPLRHPIPDWKLRRIGDPLFARPSGSHRTDFLIEPITDAGEDDPSVTERASPQLLRSGPLGNFGTRGSGTGLVAGLLTIVSHSQCMNVLW